MQERRTIMVPTDVYERLSFLQAETRLAMKEKGIKHILSKTAMTNILKTLVNNAKAEDLAELVK